MKTRKIRARRMWMQTGTETKPGKKDQPVYACYHRKVFRFDTPVVVIDVSDEAALIEQVAQAMVTACESCFPDWEPSRSEVVRSQIYTRAALASIGIVRAKRGKK